MYGSSFRVRHKEWFKEALVLMFKSMPWILLICLACYSVNFAGEKFAEAATRLDSNLIGIISVLFAIISMIIPIVFGPVVMASLIVIHRLDQGYKNNPITVGYFIFHDIQMWKENFIADKNDFFLAVLFLSGLGVGLVIIMMFLQPSEASQVSELQLAKELFWKEHPFLEFIKSFFGNIGFYVSFYILFHEAKARSTFNLFMLANSYKSVEECKIDAFIARSKLRSLGFTYIICPQIVISLMPLLNNGSPILSLISSTIAFLVTMWIIHMHYIIGRDYYIGPPPKKQKQESLDKNMQTA